MWNEGDRVVVKAGKHTGRRGTVTMLDSDELAAYFGVRPSEVRVVFTERELPVNVNAEDLETVP